MLHIGLGNRRDTPTRVVSRTLYEAMAGKRRGDADMPEPEREPLIPGRPLSIEFTRDDVHRGLKSDLDKLCQRQERMTGNWHFGTFPLGQDSKDWAALQLDDPALYTDVTLRFSIPLSPSCVTRFSLRRRAALRSQSWIDPRLQPRPFAHTDRCVQTLFKRVCNLILHIDATAHRASRREGQHVFPTIYPRRAGRRGTPDFDV
jgi:hypothetical protein